MKYEDYEQLINKIKAHEKKQSGYSSIDVMIKKIFTTIIVVVILFLTFDVLKGPTSTEYFAIIISVLALLFNILSSFMNVMQIKANNSYEPILNRILYYLHTEQTIRNSTELVNADKEKLQKLLKENLEDMYK